MKKYTPTIFGKKSVAHSFCDKFHYLKMLVITTLLIIEMGDAESIGSKMKNLFCVTLTEKQNGYCVYKAKYFSGKYFISERIKHTQ